MRDGTDCARLLRAFVRAWPHWLGGEGDAKRNGFKYHTASQRCGELSRTSYTVSAGRRIVAPSLTGGLSTTSTAIGATTASGISPV